MEEKNIFGVTSKFALTIRSILVLVVATVGVSAQSTPSELPQNPAGTQTTQEAAKTNPGNGHAVSVPAPVSGPTAEEVQKRIDRARALAAAHQLGAAARELESARGMTADTVLRHGTSIMLLGIYLEEGNYSRAQSLLEESFQARSSANENSLRSYFAVSGQAVNGVRQHLARYRSFGVNVSSAVLPPEAGNDLERLRLLLERMVAQAKEITRETPSANVGLALLEDVLGVRASLARDNEDREKWQTEYYQAREQLAFAKMQLASIDESPNLARTAPNPTSAQASVDSNVRNASQNPGVISSQVVYAGLLNQRANKRVVPAFPELAKAAGTKGIVKVHVVVDERGDVQVTKSDGPMLLKQAAEDAARGWGFAPALVDGKPVRLTGYIEFSFEL